MSATVKEMYEVFQNRLKDLKFNSCCIHWLIYPYNNKWNSLSVQIVKMCFYALHQNPQISTALAWNRIYAMSLALLTTLLNAFPVSRGTDQEMDFTRPPPPFFFFDRGKTTVSTPSRFSKPEGWNGWYSALCFGKEKGSRIQVSCLRVPWFRSHREHIAIHHHQLIPTNMA